MTCPRCGLQAYRPDRTGDWMCYACGHMPFDPSILIAALIVGVVLVALFARFVFP